MTVYIDFYRSPSSSRKCQSVLVLIANVRSSCANLASLAIGMSGSNRSANITQWCLMYEIFFLAFIIPFAKNA